MGITYIEATVKGPKGEEKVRFLIDSGVTHTHFTRTRLEKDRPRAETGAHLRARRWTPHRAKIFRALHHPSPRRRAYPRDPGRSRRRAPPRRGHLGNPKREIYPEDHPTKANGYYTRDLLTLFGPLEDLAVPRVREGDFHPKILPYRRRSSLELFKAILALYASGVTPGPSPGSWIPSTAPFTPQSISRLTQVVEDEVKAWRERPLDAEYYAIYLDGTFLSVRRGRTAKGLVYIALVIKPDGRRKVLGFWLFGAEGESAQNWEGGAAGPAAARS